MNYDKFKEVLLIAGEELAKAKLRENKDRLAEYLKIVKFLGLTDKYENKAWGKYSPEDV